MGQYEFRYLASSMKPLSTICREYSGDDQAIAAAKRLADGQALEVWHEGICVFRAPPDDPHSKA
jgi:hypothetical protein